MACAQPMKIKNPHFMEKGYIKWYLPYLEVPCGWCLNCRVDRQNWLSDAMNYEFKKYNYIGAFVTFTYDDNHIQPLANTSVDDFYLGADGEFHLFPFLSKPVQYSLRRKDCKDFLKRVRSRIDYYYKKHNLKNVDLCRKDFKYFCSGEYGDIFGRPHYHFVFFGLDYNFCQDIFYECWQNGLIDSKPIKSGCFEYVTKYLTKQCFGKQAKELYDNQNLERPFTSHSLGLGKGLILEQMDFIRSHNLCYLTDNNTLRPIPIYYRKYFFLRPFREFGKISEQMFQAGLKPDLSVSNMYYSSGNKVRYSLAKMNDFRKAQALLRHSKLKKQLERKGIVSEPLISDYTGSQTYVRKLVDSIDFELVRYGDKVPF